LAQVKPHPTHIPPTNPTDATEAQRTLTLNVEDSTPVVVEDAELEGATGAETTPETESSILRGQEDTLTMDIFKDVLIVQLHPG